MPRSIPTLRLKETAYALGDEYYKCVSTASRSRSDMDRCIETGRSYLEALEGLNKHLRSLHFDEEVDKLIRNTTSYIDLVRKELRDFETQGPRSH